MNKLVLGNIHLLSTSNTTLLESELLTIGTGSPHIISRAFQRTMHGAYANSIDAGYILGHENAGYVSELGVGVTDLQLGESVLVHDMRHCGN